MRLVWYKSVTSEVLYLSNPALCRILWRSQVIEFIFPNTKWDSGERRQLKIKSKHQKGSTFWIFSKSFTLNCS